MSVFATLIARDWREQRSSLLAVLALGAIVATIGVLVADPWVADSRMLAGIVAYSFGSLVALAVGCDLMARDRAEGSEAWVLRLPTLSCSIAASKMAFLLAATVAGTLVGVVVAWSLSQVFGTGSIEFGTWIQVAKTLVFVVSLALWTAAASTFLPRGFFAAPGGLALVALCSAPAWMPLAYYGIRPSLEHQWTWGLGCLAGGAMALRIGATSGMREGGRLLRRARRVATLGAVGFLPAWVPTAEIVHDLRTYDLVGNPGHLSWTYLSEDGRYLVGSASELDPDGPVVSEAHPVAYDFEERRWQALGFPQRYVEPATTGDWIDGRVETFRLTVPRRSFGPSDATDGQLLSNSFDLLERGEVEDLGHPLAGDPDWRLVGRAGTGWSYRQRVEQGSLSLWIDATGKERLEDHKQLAWGVEPAGGVHVANVWRARDHWMGLLYMRSSPQDLRLMAVELDLERRVWVQPAWSEQITQPVAGLANGQLLALRGPEGAAELVLVDPSTGATTPAPIRIEGLREPWPARDRGPLPWVGIVLETEAGGGLLIVEDVERPEPAFTWTGPLDYEPYRVSGKRDDGSWIVNGRTGTWLHSPDGQVSERLWPPTTEERNSK